MMNYKLPTRNVSVSLIMEVIARCCHNGADINSLIQYTDKTKPYIISAIDSGCLLGMLEIQQNRTWRTVKHCAGTMGNPCSEEFKLAVFTKWLQMWNPFILFLKYTQTGDSINIAARKLCSRYSFSNDNHEALAKLLFGWARNCKLMDAKGELAIAIQDTGQQDLLNIISEDLNDDAQARMYLVKELGEDVFDWLKPDEIQELENGVLKCKQHPKDAVTSIGRALEDVLKRIYIDLLGFDSQDLIKKNTIAQLAQCLRNKESIHAKQLHIILAQASVRNMGSHGKEIESMEKWEISSTAAMGTLSSTLALIKSLFHYVKYGKLLF